MRSPEGPALVLASSSPRRAEILRLLGLEFEVRNPQIEETVAPGEPPDSAARRLAREKVLGVPHEAEELVLGADTFVVCEGVVLGKPTGAEDAVRLLERLAGREHTVYTGLAAGHAGRVEAGVAATRVWFRPVARLECEEYVATGEPLDKAGAYGIQGFGAALVERIEGEYFNVMGLPVQLFLSLIERLGLRYAYGRVVPR